jgi:hypothetical protein
MIKNAHEARVIKILYLNLNKSRMIKNKLVFKIDLNII